MLDRNIKFQWHRTEMSISAECVPRTLDVHYQRMLQNLRMANQISEVTINSMKISKPYDRCHCLALINKATSTLVPKS